MGNLLSEARATLRAWYVKGGSIVIPGGKQKQEFVSATNILNLVLAFWVVVATSACCWPGYPDAEFSGDLNVTVLELGSATIIGVQDAAAPDFLPRIYPNSSSSINTVTLTVLPDTTNTIIA